MECNIKIDHPSWTPMRYLKLSTLDKDYEIDKGSTYRRDECNMINNQLCLRLLQSSPSSTIPRENVIPSAINYTMRVCNLV